MARLIWKRKIKVEVAGLTITAPKMKLDIRSDVSSTPVGGEVEIWNLSSSHERRIYDRGGDITVSAGYGDVIGVVFKGVVDRVFRERMGMGHSVRIRVASKTAKREEGRVSGFVSIQAGKNVSLRTLVEEVVRHFKYEDEEKGDVALGSVDLIPDVEVNHERLFGSTGIVLRNLLKDHRIGWYDDNGVIRFNKAGVVSKSSRVVFSVSNKTGMIGIPSETDEGWRVRVFMDYRATIGNRIRLKSEYVSGTFKIVGVHHFGDNWTGKFVTEMELRRPE